MLALSEKNKAKINLDTDVLCYHCGASCMRQGYKKEDKSFCCNGCLLVYELLEHNGLCDYYTLQSHPGLSQIKPIRKEKYAYLDDISFVQLLLSFSDGDYSIVTFFIPAIHCSSCMWLLEHLYKINSGIEQSRINFSTKEVSIHYRGKKISLRQVVELLATIGYEPAIQLDNDKTRDHAVNKPRLYKLGISGFCFGNIMLMSLPEYFSNVSGSGMEHQYVLLFRVLNLILSIPVFFYSASEFFVTAWKGLKQKTLNIDAPVVLALIITYTRSLYEVFTNTGGGYFDSMTGIVFFMLVGRVLQERTYRFLSFHRDYKAYFPMAATVVKGDSTTSKPIAELEKHDVIKVFHQEVIPADGKVIEGQAFIDYSFVTGENEPVEITIGGNLFAGGRQIGQALLVEVTKPVSSSYLTSLWNHKTFAKNKQVYNDRTSAVHVLSKYFTVILLALASITAIYWWGVDPGKILPSVSAMLIVACPCALLLTAVYTNGNLLRILSDNGLYLRDATVIEQLSEINEMVFDKTGTLTHSGKSYEVKGYDLNEEEISAVYSIAMMSSHPVSRQLTLHLGKKNLVEVCNWKEIAGAGLEAAQNGKVIRIGSEKWTAAYLTAEEKPAEVYVQYDSHLTAFHWQPQLRLGAMSMLKDLRTQYGMSMLSGDNDRHQKNFETFFDKDALFFNQKPIEKLEYIERLQEAGQHVLMVGDGLNDAGALQQSNVGITLADDINNFSPSCDAILRADQLAKLPAMLKLCKRSKYIIQFAFFISILYNIIGLTISMCGEMNPMIAAILMPLSTLTIVLITTGASNFIASRLGLEWRKK